MAPDGAHGQLGDLVRAPDKWHQPDPWPQALVGFEDRSLLVDEDGVDREPHEHHVDPIAAMNQQAPIFGQPLPAHQPDAAGDEIARDLEWLRYDRPVLFR